MLAFSSTKYGNLRNIKYFFNGNSRSKILIIFSLLRTILRTDSSKRSFTVLCNLLSFKNNEEGAFFKILHTEYVNRKKCNK